MVNFPLTHQSIPHVQANEIIRLNTVATKIWRRCCQVPMLQTRASVNDF